MARTLVQSDAFNRASLDANWSQVNPGNAGDVLIDSSIRIRGQYSVQPTDQKATAKWVGSGSFTDDQYSSIEISDNPVGYSTGNGIGVVCRVTGTNSTRSLYEAWVEGGGGGSPTTYLTKWVSGTRTVLHSSTATSWAANDLLSLECEGTTIRLCKNGTPLGGSFTATDSSVTTGVPGVVAAGNTLFGDDWEGGNITGGASVAPIAAYYQMMSD